MKLQKNDLEAILPDAEWKIKSPGRVNLLGEHVDYNDGVVLPTAINLYVKMLAQPRDDDKLILHALDFNEKIELSTSTLRGKRDLSGNSLPRWAQYPAAVGWAFQQKGFYLKGLEAAFTSDLPIGAGLSSSAAVELAFAEFWKVVGNWKINRMQMAEICQFAENEYVGVNCGLMDQFACAHGISRHILLFDLQSKAWQPIPISMDTSIVIVDSTMRRNLIDSEYNNRRNECQSALDIIRKKNLNIHSLREISVNDLGEIEKILPLNLFNRVRHVVEEIERVKKGCQLLMQDDLAGFGQLMIAGHESLRDLYEVSIPQLDLLVDIAINLPGCYGARLTGAGFGGCTVNLVEYSKIEEFSNRLKREYHQKFNIFPEIYVCKPARGVHIQELK